MNNNKHIAFLLGAGFSVPAGLPTANTLNKLIISEIYNRIRKSFKEGEEGILQSFILEKVLIDIDEYGDFNYELYYDLLEQEKEKNLDYDRLLSFIDRGMYGYLWKYSKLNDQNLYNNTKTIQETFEYIVVNCKNYSKEVEDVEALYQRFIADNLKDSKIKDFNSIYNGFVSILLYYVNQGYIIDIYTLNHDLFLESILSHTDLKDMVCNGFGGHIKTIRKRKYKTFDLTHFNNYIRIYKLHGSIDIHEYYNIDNPLQYIQIIEGYSFENAFLTDKQGSASIYPLFITGKTSKEKQYSRKPYSILLNEFEKNIGKAEKLIVIGYSGNDDGINNILKGFMHWDNSYVVDPHANEHHFVKNHQATPLNKGIEFLKCCDIL